MNANWREPIVIVAVVGLAALVLAGGDPGRDPGPASAQGATPTPDRVGLPSPIGSPHPTEAPIYPLPEAEDRASAATMAAGGAAMVQAAAAMERAAEAMIASGDSGLVELGDHWRRDAAALRERGAWMVTSATSDSMVHDPIKAHEINLWNLKANGVAMVAEGEAMVEHGRAMAAEVERLEREGALPPALVDELIAGADALEETGETLIDDGGEMERVAERLLRSIGR